MTNKFAGWTLGLASLGWVLILISADIKNLHTMDEVYTPSFISNMVGHVGNVIMAFVGGKLVPTGPKNQRADD